MNLFCRFLEKERLLCIVVHRAGFSVAEFCIDVVAGNISLNVRFNPC